MVLALVGWLISSQRWDVPKLGRIGLAATTLVALAALVDIPIGPGAQAGSQLVILSMAPVAVWAFIWVIGWVMLRGTMALGRGSRSAARIVMRRRAWIAAGAALIVAGGVVFIGEPSVAFALGSDPTTAAWMKYAGFLLRGVGLVALGLFGLALLASVLGDTGRDRSGPGPITFGQYTPRWLDMKNDPIGTGNAERSDAETRGFDGPP